MYFSDVYTTYKPYIFQSLLHFLFFSVDISNLYLKLFFLDLTLLTYFTELIIVGMALGFLFILFSVLFLFSAIKGQAITILTQILKNVLFDSYQQVPSYDDD